MIPFVSDKKTPFNDGVFAFYTLFIQLSH